MNNDWDADKTKDNLKNSQNLNVDNLISRNKLSNIHDDKGVKAKHNAPDEVNNECTSTNPWTHKKIS